MKLQKPGYKNAKEFVRTRTKTEKLNKEKFTEAVDYYLENGLMVLTERFLEKRGYCCENNCRHCPYKIPRKDDYNK